MLLRRNPARDDDELIRYLLGELPDDRAEQLDERSVVEDDFVARLRLVEDDLVDAYLAGRLPGERRARFEAFYLTSPRRRERTSFAKRLLDAVDREANRGTGNGGGRMTRWLPWGLAAAVVLCVGAGWLLVRDARLENALTSAQHRLAAADRQASSLSTQIAAQQQAALAAQTALAQARSAQPGMAVALVLMPQTRGVGPVPIVSVGPDSRRVPIELAVIDAAPDRSYDAALRDPATGAIVWRSTPLALVDVRPVPVIVVDLPAGLLKAQHYTVDVMARRAGGPAFVGSYAFEVVRR